MQATWTFKPVPLSHIPVDPGQTPESVVADMQARLVAVKPHRDKRGGKLEGYEKRGEKALAQPDAVECKATWRARIGYTSMGGERLCFDAGPMTRQAAESLASEYGGAAWNAAWTPGCAVNTSPAYAAAEVTGRLVVLPSQRTELVETCTESDAPTLESVRASLSEVRQGRTELIAILTAARDAVRAL